MVAQLDTECGVMTVATTHLSVVPGWNRIQLRQLMRDLPADCPGRGCWWATST